MLWSPRPHIRSSQFPRPPKPGGGARSSRAERNQVPTPRPGAGRILEAGRRQHQRSALPGLPPPRPSSRSGSSLAGASTAPNGPAPTVREGLSRAQQPHHDFLTAEARRGASGSAGSDDNRTPGAPPPAGTEWAGLLQPQRAAARREPSGAAGGPLPRRAQLAQVEDAQCCWFQGVRLSLPSGGDQQGTRRRRTVLTKYWGERSPHCFRDQYFCT